MLINIAPTGDGRIMPIYEERLRQMGEWLKINGQAIYGSTPWPTCQNDSVTHNVWYTKGKDGNVYAIVNDWPKESLLQLGCPIPKSVKTVSLLGYTGTVVWIPKGKQLINIDTSKISATLNTSQWAWVFRITGTRN